MTKPVGTSPQRSSTPADDGRPLGAGIPLGRWGGVPVSAHWSVLFTLLLFADLLAESVLPSALPRQDTVAYWLAGSITAIVFLASLLLHEVAHAVTARRHGMKVRRITLWMLGGMTELDGEPPSPRADALIAAAGPATSLGIGGLAWGLAAGLGSGLTAVSLAWLGSVNVLLAVFNLLPGAPLDGGRLLRAVLWAHYHDRTRAAAVAARTGRGLGTAFVVLGIVEVLAGGLAGLWLMLVGWFIVTAAGSERAVSRTEALRGIRAGEVMVPVTAVVPDWWTVERFLGQLNAHDATQPAFALVDFGGQSAGVLTLRDLETVPRPERGDRRLRDVAARRRLPPLVVELDADVADLAPQLARYGGVAVVADDGRPQGLITSAELLRAAQLAALEWRATDAPRC